MRSTWFAEVRVNRHLIAFRDKEGECLAGVWERGTPQQDTGATDLGCDPLTDRRCCCGEQNRGRKWRCFARSPSALRRVPQERRTMRATLSDWAGNF